MSVIAEFTIPAGEFALGHLLEVREGVKVRLESMIPTGDAMLPYFWVQSPDVEAVEEALLESPMVSDVKVVDVIGDETLFRVDWAENIDGLITSIQQSDGVVLQGEGHGDYWTFQLRFPEYDSLSTFYRDTVDSGISIDLGNVHNPIEANPASEMGITPEQYEALDLAVESGYFSIPRETTLIEMAEELGISDSAVSQRIRRGLHKLLSSTIFTEST